MTIEHDLLANDPVANSQHGIVHQTVADAAALAAVVVTASDVAQCRVFRQTDTDQLWRPITTGAGATFRLLTAFATGIRETSGPTNLTIGALPDSSLLTRVGTAVVAATFSAGLSLAAGVLTLAQVSNLAQGALTAITAANAVPLSNGGGTAAVWTALSGGGNPVGSSRTISTTSPLSGGGDLSANRVLSVATVDNTTAGVAPITNAAAGQALISSATTVGWGTNFSAQNLTTTGGYIADSATGFVRLGLVAGSGSGVQSAAAAGNIRGARGSSSTGFLLALRNNGDTADINGMQWDSASNVLAVGQSGTGGNTTLQLNCITSVSIRRTGATVMATFNSTGLNVVGNRFSFDSAVVTDCEVNFLGASAATGLNLTVRAQPGTTTGGRATLIGGDATNASSTGGAVLVQTGAGGAGGAGGMGALSAGVTGSAVNRFRWNDTGIGFYATAPVALQNITGSRGGNAALADLLTKLALTGLLTDGTTA